MKTYQRMVVHGLCLIGGVIGGATIEHDSMYSRVAEAESRIEQITAEATHMVEATRKQHEFFITQLPNYHRGAVWSGDALGNAWYDEAKGLQDLQDHYVE
jgi:hypothetical protein